MKKKIKRICYFCLVNRGFCSNNPKYGCWVCEPCYYILVKSPGRLKLIWKFFKSHDDVIIQSKWWKKIIQFLKWIWVVPKIIYFRNKNKYNIK